jgi:outer membrane protein TolC
MKKNKMKWFSLLLFVVIINVCFSQQALNINYDVFLKSVLENNPLATRANNETQYGRLLFKAARGNYDPLINGNYNNKFFSEKNYFTYFNAEVKQPIFTNQYLKFGYDYATGSNINPELYTLPNGLPYLGLEVGVLQGLVIDKRRAEVLKAKNYLKYYDAESKIQLNNLLFESASQYFDWLFSNKQIALNNYFMGIARQRLLGIEALANIGERASIDTVEAAIFYQSRLMDLQNAIIDNQKSINNINIFNWQPNGNLQNIIINAEDSLEMYFVKAKNKLLNKIYTDTAVNPMITKYNSFGGVLQVEARFRREMIKPIVNVNYNFLSYNPTDYNPAFSTNNYKWGLNVSFPLLLRNSINEYKMSKLLLQNNGLELQNKRNELNFKVNALLQNISILSQQLVVSQTTAKYSKQLEEAEKLKFENGESSLFLLNTRENKWLESELKLAEYKLKFIKTILNIIYLNGTLDYTLQ